MGLVRCPDCDREISESAQDCPGCGRPMVPPVRNRSRPERQASQAWLLVSILLLLSFLFLGTCWYMAGKVLDTAFKAGPEDLRLDAYAQYQVAVEGPPLVTSLASFGCVSYTDVKRDLATGRYAVASYVDAANAFGAKLRQPFSCTVSTHDGGQDMDRNQR
jgi:hypothetical protein